MNRRPTAALVGTLLAAGLCGLVRAQDGAGDAAPPAAAPARPHERLPLWELGLAGVAADVPAYPGSDQNILRARVLPYGIYRGAVLRADGDGIGVRALRTPRFEWDLSGSGSFGSAANRVRARQGMPAIGTLVEAGPALKVNLGDLLEPGGDARRTQLELPVRAVFDLSHHFDRRGFSFEPRLAHTLWTQPGSALVVSAAAFVGDRALNRLYYGVDAPFATPDRPAYTARAGLIASRLNASLRHRIGPTLQWIAFARVETVRGAANEASPLVRRREDAGVGVALLWGAWQSERAGED